jgi:Uma2 family endonuclease
MLIDLLWDYFLSQSRVYVSGNLLVFYERGNRRKHVSPDVFFVKGVEKRRRPNYLVWEEGRAPQVVIELTSSSTRKEDTDTKFALYRDVLKVREYFLFDPDGDYLDPRLQGYRLRGGEYHPIRPVAGRLPSRLFGLHLEAEGNLLRLWDPEVEAHLLTQAQLRERTEQQLEQTQQRLQQAQERIDELVQRGQRIDELERRVAQLEALVNRLTGQGNGPT